MSHPARPTVIAANQTAGDITLADLGAVVPASGSLTLSDLFYLHETQASKDLFDAVTANNILIDDGTGLLTKPQSLLYITGVASKQDLQLGVTGPSSAVVNQVPKFGDTTGKALVASSITINGSNELDMAAAKIVNIALPTTSTDVASKGYVDSLINGLDPKASVRAATTVSITLSAPQTIDGVSVIAGNRVLVKDQGTGSQNGIYIVAAGAWTRSLDMAAGSSAAGVYCYVEEGTIAQDKGYICNNNVGADVVGTDALIFSQFGSFQLATVAPDNVTKSAAVVGVSSRAAREDHKHDVTTAAPAATGVGTASGEGSATSLARSDHSHQSNTAPAAVTKAAAAIGTSGEPARADHKHDVTTAAPATGIGASNAEGSATTLARSDHNHQIRESGGQNLTMGAVADGQTFVRSGTTIAGQTAATAASLTHKNVVRVATAAAGTLATSFANGQTVDGVVVATSDRILLKDQASGIENGLYTVNAAGAPTRTTDLPTAASAGGVSVYVQEGSANADTGWLCTTNNPSAVVGTNSLVFAKRAFPLASTTPANVTKAAAATGTSETAARSDHKHDVTTAAPAAAGVSTASADGVATTLARSDHSHQSNTAPASVTKAAAAIGTSGEPARADHKHDVTTAAPAAGGVGTTSAEGTATTLARSDHTHQSNTAPASVTKAAAAIGTSTEPARADHKHDVTTAAPATGIGAANTEGTATTLARSDHDHLLRESGGQALSLGAIADGEIVRRSGTTLVGGAGRTYPAAATDPVAPTPANGDRYFNTVLNMEMYFDSARSKWLSVETVELFFGRNGNTAAGGFYRGMDSAVMSSTNGMRAEHNGTVVSLSYMRSDSDSATFVVAANGVAGATLASTATSGGSTTLNTNFAAGDVMAVLNQLAAGNTTSNVQGRVRMRYRL